jgi:hypothetical protein
MNEGRPFSFYKSDNGIQSEAGSRGPLLLASRAMLINSRAVSPRDGSRNASCTLGAKTGRPLTSPLE